MTGALTTFARPDGKMQVAINGRPLYYFAADSKAGDTTGQGVGGKWFVATPTGVTAVPGRLACGVARRQLQGRLLTHPGGHAGRQPAGVSQTG